MTQPEDRKNNLAEDWKRDLCELFFAHRGTIVTTTVLVFLGAVVIAFLWPPTYRATCSVLIRGKRPEVSAGALEVTDVRSMPVSTEDVASELEILNSPELVERTVRYLREHPDTAKRDTSNVTVAEKIRNTLKSLFKFQRKPELAIQDEVRHLRKELTIEVVPQSKVIRVMLRNGSQANAERCLDTLLNQYVGYRSEVFNPRDQKEFFTRQCEQYRIRLEALEDRLAAAAEEATVTLPELEMTNNMELKRDLMGRLSLLRDEYVASSFVQDRTLEARMTLLQMTIKEIEDRNIELQRHALDMQRVMRERELIESSYQTFAKRGEEAAINAEIAKASLSADVTVLSKAALTAERVFPNKPLTLALGLLVGFLTGCSLAFVVEFFDHTFRSPIQVARYTDLPVLCSIKKV